MKKNILILSEPFGGGHTRVAEAVKEMLNNWNCTICELGHYLQPQLTPYFIKGYLETVQRVPWVWEKIYFSSLPESPLIPYMYRKLYFSKLAKLLLQTKPDLIIVTHPFCAFAIGALRKYNIHIPLFGILTDFHIHPCWALTNCDVLFTPSTDIPMWLKSKKTVISSGIPVLPEFYIPKGENSTIPTILWMGGSQGIYKRMDWIKNIVHDTSIHWIFVAGKNEKLVELLQKTLGCVSHVKIFGYCANISALMDCAHLIITKAGGVTCSEAIQKELPILLSEGLSGQEEENASFLIRHGLAIDLAGADIWTTIKKIFDQKEKIENVKMNILQYKKTIHPKFLSSLINSYLSKQMTGTDL